MPSNPGGKRTRQVERFVDVGHIRHRLDSAAALHIHLQRAGRQGGSTAVGQAGRGRHNGQAGRRGAWRSTLDPQRAGQRSTRLLPCQGQPGRRLGDRPNRRAAAHRPCGAPIPCALRRCCVQQTRRLGTAHQKLGPIPGAHRVPRRISPTPNSFRKIQSIQVEFQGGVSPKRRIRLNFHINSTKKNQKTILLYFTDYTHQVHLWRDG